MDIGAIILTAGLMNNSINPLHLIDDKTIISLMIEKLRELEVSPILVVIGDKKEILRSYLEEANVEIVCNDNYDGEMFSSIKIGIESLKNKCDKIVLIKGNVPAFSLSTLNIMLDSNAEIVRPKYEDKYGHPIVINRKYFDNIVLRENIEGGLERILGEFKAETEVIDVDDAGVILKNDSIDNFELIKNKMLKDLKKDKRYHVSVDFGIVGEKQILNKESALLFYLIDKTHSLRLASDCLHISYSKAWNMIKNIESQTNIDFVKKSVGGYKGGNTVLSDEGKKILTEYRRIDEAIRKAAEELSRDNLYELMKKKND